MDVVAIDPSVKMISAICRQASEDAELVVEVLDSIYESKNKIDRQSIALTQEQLLGLGAVVRLAKWEFNQIPNLLKVDLPSSRSVLQRICNERPSHKLTTFVHDLRSRIFQFYFQSFVWSGNDCGLTLDLAMSDVDINELLNGVADLLVAQIQTT